MPFFGQKTENDPAKNQSQIEFGSEKIKHNKKHFGSEIL